MADTTKRCIVCGGVKPHTAFSKDKTRLDGLDPRCKVCRSAQGKLHYAANRDAINQRRKLFEATHPEHIRERGQRSYRRHRENHRRLMALWHSANKDKVSARHAQRRRDHPEEGRLRNALHRKNSPHKVRAAQLRRRARETGAQGGGITAEQVRRTIADSLGLCIYCNANAKLAVDHVDPLARGGDNDPTNLVAACRSCNASKSDTPLIVWLANRMRRRRAA